MSENEKCESTNEKPCCCRPLPKTPVIIREARAAHDACEALSGGAKLIYIIRHGLTDWNLSLRLQGRENVPLNEDGILQAKTLAGLLVRARNAGMNADMLCSSPLSRAYDTANIIAQRLSYETVNVMDNLIERDYGSLSGLTLAERKQKFPCGERQAGDVECVYNSALRIKAALEEIARTAAHGAIVVTHGGVINALFSNLTDGSVGTGKNISENCSISIVASSQDGHIPLAYNLQGDGVIEYIKAMCA